MSISAGYGSKLDKVASDIVKNNTAKQDAYLARHGQYFQMIWTHDAVPTELSASAPKTDKKPTDQNETAADFGVTLPASMSVSASIHIYEIAGGHGWFVEVRGSEAGKIYSVAKNGKGSMDMAHTAEEVINGR